MAKLDRSQPFGEVIGHTKAKYEQNCKTFNSHGVECDEHGEVVGEAGTKGGC